MNDTTRTPTHVACAHCGATNRVPAERLREDPVCGRCGQALLDGHPVELSDANFDAVVAASDLPVVVDFWAPWCGPCKMMAPAYEQAATQLEPQFRVAKVNTEAVPNLGARFQIRSIPTLVLFVNGRELVRRPGALGANDIVRWARSNT